MGVEMEQKSFPCVVFAKVKKIGSRNNDGKEEIKEQVEYWYLNVQQGHRKLDKLNQFIQGGSKLIGYQNLDRDYRMNNGQMVRASNFTEIKNFVDAHTGKAIDPRLRDLDVRPDPLADKVADEQKRRAR